jgi:hypothetical protein
LRRLARGAKLVRHVCDCAVPMRKRPPLPTLTEDDVRMQGERTTMPPPVPIDELVGGMMNDMSGEIPAVRRPPPVRRETGELEMGELEGSAESDLLVEISEAYLSRLGGRTHVPFTLMTQHDTLRVHLDHWAGFVLSLIDGVACVDDVLDAASLPEHETLRLLCELREQGLIDLRPAPVPEGARRPTPEPPPQPG